MTVDVPGPCGSWSLVVTSGTAISMKTPKAIATSTARTERIRWVFVRCIFAPLFTELLLQNVPDRYCHRRHDQIAKADLFEILQ